MRTEDEAIFLLDLLEGATDPGNGAPLNVADLTLMGGDESGVTVSGNSLTVNPNAYNSLAVGDSEVITYSFNIVDGEGGSVAQTATITIIGVNDDPEATANSATTSQDGPAVTFNVTGDDTDVDNGDILAVSSVDTTGVLGTVSFAGTDITYDPNGNFDYLAFGSSTTESFIYTVSDGNGGYDTADITVTINGVNDDPEPQDDYGATDEETAIDVDVLENDSDIDVGDGLVATVGATSTNGATLSVNPDGTINYDPSGSSTLQALNTGQSLVDTFTYQVSDGNGGTATATAHITVEGMNEMMTFDDLTGFPLSYSEGGMTVTSKWETSPGDFNTPHVHTAGPDDDRAILYHSGCCSTPYEFRYADESGDAANFTFVNFLNHAGTGEWTSSSGGSYTPTQNGFNEFGSGFENVEWVRWSKNEDDDWTNDNVIEDIEWFV